MNETTILKYIKENEEFLKKITEQIEISKKLVDYNGEGQESFPFLAGRFNTKVITEKLKSIGDEKQHYEVRKINGFMSDVFANSIKRSNEFKFICYKNK